MTVVSLTRVAMTHPGGVHALRDVHLEIQEGELVGVVGPSGSGKSTLLHVMGTLARPTAGRVRIAGHDVGSLDDRRLSALRAHHIGFVFQQFHLAPGVPVLDAVADGLLYAGVRIRERRRRAGDLLAGLGLGARLSHRPHQLSGGERQRVAIARAVIGAPALLLADEPTGNLDSAATLEVLRLFDELRNAGQTLVLVTHDERVAATADRLVSMRDGAFVGDTPLTGGAGRLDALLGWDG